MARAPFPAGAYKSATDEHRAAMQPGPRAFALWARYPELFPNTVRWAQGLPDLVYPPYPRRRLSYEGSR